jgi:hypothetical protein
MQAGQRHRGVLPRVLDENGQRREFPIPELPITLLTPMGRLNPAEKELFLHPKDPSARVWAADRPQFVSLGRYVRLSGPGLLA